MNIRTTPQKMSFITELGLVLVLIGMQFGTALRNIFPDLELVYVIMGVSVICVCNFKNFLNYKFPIYNKWYGLIIIFQFILLIYAGFADRDDFLFYHLYIIFLTISISSNNRNLIFPNFLRIVLYVSGFISLVVLYQATFGFNYLNSGGYEETGRLWLTEGGDPITIARALTINIIALLLYKPTLYYEKLLKILFVISSIIGLFSFSTRGAMLALLISFVLYYWNVNGIKSQLSRGEKIKRGAYILAFIVILILLYNKSDYFYDKIIAFFDNLSRGITTYFVGAGNNNVDVSTMERNLKMKRVFDTYNDNISWFNIFFGNGYYTLYIDIPIVQAFFDLGIFGFIYFLITMYLPFKANIYRTANYYPYLFIKLCTIQIFLDQLFNGLPYYFTQYTPIILVIFFQRNIIFKKN